MLSRNSRADKPRRLAADDPAGAGDDPAATPAPQRRRWLRQAIVLAAVSGIGIAGVSAFGTATTATTGLAFANQQLPSALADRNAGLSRASERAAVSIEDLAAARAEAIAKANEDIEDGQDAAALVERQQQLAATDEDVEAEATRLRNLSKFLWPTAGSVNSGYGMRMHPILHYLRMHDGDDIGGKCGQPVYAAQSGTVISAAMGYNGGSGNNIWIDHGQIDGHDVSTGYLHLTDYVVAVGDTVDKGEVVGHVGSTGLSTACHLHFSAKIDGSSTDPMQFIGWNKQAKQN